jgi:fructose-bisphosphate aldolase class I
MNSKILKLTAQKMVTKGKGILAADESTPTCTKRFESIGIKSTSESRNKYRDMLFTTNGLEKYISGIIMFDETIRQSTIHSKVPFPKYLNEKDILTGIKVDTGAKKLAGTSSEKITEGLDNLRDRIQEYRDLGASFAKWRGVVSIDTKNSIPSKACIHANAHALARYASICQESDIVPIVEPEIIMDGDHDIEKCQEITKVVLNNVFDELSILDVLLEGIVLKPNMVISGSAHPINDSVENVAKLTLDTLIECVPKEVPGIAFLSGGQDSSLATTHLNLINKISSNLTNTWHLTFSFGRALQQDALNLWKEENIKLSQEKLLYRAKMNSIASQGLIE